jgi:protein-disulfide isomerase
LLATAGTAAALGTAGCLGGRGDDGQNGGPSGVSIGSHDATAGIDTQPRLGPPPGEAPGLIVAFEDPSCPRCGVFERETVPKIRSELVANEEATFVFRGYPVVYPWGEPASRALEATFEHDSDAHWALAAHYFANQDAFRSAGPDEVLPRTRSFLAGETSVDADAVVTAVESGEADGAVQTDLDAGQAAEVSGTPTVFLFRDGGYRTRASGSIGFSVVKNALGL